METNPSRTRWTYAEFARLPSEGGTRHEVIDGELVVTPAPATRHQRIVTDLVVLLHSFVRAQGAGQVFAGPIDVLLAEGDYMEPDIVFVGRGKAHLLSDRGVEGPPDLVVEVASPSTARRDRGPKLERYRLFDVPEYWVVDPDARTVEEWELAAGVDEPSVWGAGEVLRWRPAGAESTLEIDVGELLGG